MTPSVPVRPAGIPVVTSRRGSYGGTVAERVGLKVELSVDMKTLPSDGRRR